jgi:streptogramin lyase
VAAAAVTIDKFPDQGRIVSAADRVWVLTDEGAKLTALDESSNSRSTTVPLPGRCADLAAAGTTVWVMCPLEDRVLRFDARAGEVSDELELAGAANASVSDDLWVAFEGGVAQIDTTSLEVKAVYEVYPRYGGAILATPDTVWVRTEGRPFLTRIDPKSGQIVETFRSPEFASSGDVVPIGSSVWLTAYANGAIAEMEARP